MDEFVKLSPGQKKLFFQKTSDDLSLPEHIIEKDFWVCWTLKNLFSLENIKDSLTFKGGTSLSKVYNLIRRFSEDIDVSIERAYLGFKGERDPSNARSGNEAKKLIKELGESCREFVQGELKSSLENIMREKFEKGDNWQLVIDEEDPDGQTLLFYYPSEGKTVSDYVGPSVKIEMGARADHWPVEMRGIISYAAQSAPQGFSHKEAEIRVLSVERTFWEKATILHRFANFSEDKLVPIRQSRHYYDFYCLLKSDSKDKAIKQVGLLEKVADHKSLYFREAWAKYDEARKGTLKIIPSERVLREMKSDYAKMEEMFFDDPPAWDDIVMELKEFETTFNGYEK